MRKQLIRKGFVLAILMAFVCFMDSPATAKPVGDVDPAFQTEMATYNAKIAAAKTKSQKISESAAAEQVRIDAAWAKYRYDIKRAAEIRAAVAKQAADEGNFPRPAKAVLKVIFSTIPAMVVSGMEGVKAISDSPLENPVSWFCRGVNTAKSQMIGHFVGCGKEALTPFEKVEYTDPSQLNALAKRSKEHGPITQLLKTAMMVVPPALLATGAMEGIQDVSQAGSIAITASTGGVVGEPIAEAADYLEKALTKTVFGK